MKAQTVINGAQTGKASLNKAQWWANDRRHKRHKPCLCSLRQSSSWETRCAVQTCVNFPRCLWFEKAVRSFWMPSTPLSKKQAACQRPLERPRRAATAELRVMPSAVLCCQAERRFQWWLIQLQLQLSPFVRKKVVVDPKFHLWWVWAECNSQKLSPQRKKRICLFGRNKTCPRHKCYLVIK